MPHYDLDYSARIDALPKHAGYTALPVRTKHNYITFHYSGVVYADRSEAAELKRILDEAAYQLGRDYGGGAYPDGLLYDYVVLSSGKVVKTRSTPKQLWHCGNALGNAESISVHVMLGKNQPLTAAQRASLFRLFDELRAEHNIPIERVVAHCEWPRSSGAPQPSKSFKILAGQSECPGALLHAELVDYRARVLPVDPFAAWGSIFPLSEEQKAWSIPQFWLKNQWLGQATSYEIYLDSYVSAQSFENGVCLYHAKSGKVDAIKR